MDVWKNLGLKWKQTLQYLMVGLVPLAAVMVMTNVSFKEVRQLNAATLQSAAENIADKVDRNIFERYGDVQAFGLNTVALDRGNWYKPDGPIVESMNKYVDTYDLYYLTLLVDLEGKVIGINTRDQDGKPVSTQGFYQRNYKNAQWFQDVLAEKYYTSQDGNVGGAAAMTGTVYVPLHVEPEVKEAYAGDDGLSMGFAAPVKDASGQVVAVWYNYAKFSLVEDIFKDAYQNLKDKGLANAELTLLNGNGQVIVDYDPGSGMGTEKSVKHDFDTLFKLNLVEKGVNAAVSAAKNKKSGFEYAHHARKKIEQAAGYAHHRGAMGFPGMNWSVLVRDADSEVNASIVAIERRLFAVIAVFLGLILAYGVWSARALTAPIIALTDGLENFAEGNLRAIQELQAKSSDELGRMAGSFNGLFHTVKTFLQNADDLLAGKLPKSENFGLQGEFERKLGAMLDQAKAKKMSDEEVARFAVMLKSIPANVIYADSEFKINYMNPASQKNLQALEQYLPVKAGQIVGQSIDIFHKNPRNVRKIVSDPRNLPHHATIQLGPEVLDLMVTAI
ncbi:MAG: HAMP domain-containing protein, partial [Nitrospinae bacterium]|nr:HAMP domain-containing protein [Nitrospinota bacterium]